MKALLQQFADLKDRVQNEIALREVQIDQLNSENRALKKLLITKDAELSYLKEENRLLSESNKNLSEQAEAAIAAVRFSQSEISNLKSQIQNAPQALECGGKTPLSLSPEDLALLHNLVVSEHNDLYNRDGRCEETEPGRNYIADLQRLAVTLHQPGLPCVVTHHAHDDDAIQPDAPEAEPVFESASSAKSVVEKLARPPGPPSPPRPAFHREVA